MSKSELDKKDNDSAENFSNATTGWTSTRSSEAPNYLESQIHVGSDSPSVEVRRRPSSWDGSDDEFSSPSTPTISHKSRIYSTGLNKTPELVTSDRNKIKQESIPSFERQNLDNSMENLICQFENLEDESRLKVKKNQINRRQSPARIRRRTKSSRNSSPILDLKSLVSSSPEEESFCNQNQEVNKYYLDYPKKLASRELDLNSKVFLDSIFSELRTQRVNATNIENCALSEDESPSRIEKGAETDSNFFTNSGKKETIPETNESDLKQNIYNGSDKYYCRTSRKLSKIIEVEEAKKESDDKFREKISETNENKKKKLFYNPLSGEKSQYFDHENDNSSDENSPLPTARSARAPLSAKDYDYNYFSNPNSARSKKMTNIDKNSTESISERCHRLFQPVDNDDIIFLTPKSAQTEIGFDQESNCFGNETVTNFLQDYSMSGPWIENFFKDNRDKNLKESLKIDLSSPTSTEQSPSKNINDSFKSNETKIRNITYSNIQSVNESPKFKINIHEDSSRSLEMEDVQTPTSDVNFHENMDEEKTQEKNVLLIGKTTAARNSESSSKTGVKNNKTETKLKKFASTNLKNKETNSGYSLVEGGTGFSIGSGGSPKAASKTEKLMYNLSRNEALSSCKALKNALYSSLDEFDGHSASHAKILELNAIDDNDSNKSARSLESYKSSKSQKSSSSSRQDDEFVPNYMMNSTKTGQNSELYYSLSLESPKFPSVVQLESQNSKKLISKDEEKGGTIYRPRQSGKMHDTRKENQMSSQATKDQKFIPSFRSSWKDLNQSKTNVKDNADANNAVRLEKILNLKEKEIVSKKLMVNSSNSRFGTGLAEVRNYASIEKSSDELDNSNFRENKSKFILTDLSLKASKSTEMIKTFFECKQHDNKGTSNWYSVQESPPESSTNCDSNVLKNKMLQESQDDKSVKGPKYFNENLLEYGRVVNPKGSKRNKKTEENVDALENLELLFERGNTDNSKMSRRKNSAFEADEENFDKGTARSHRSRSSTEKSPRKNFFAFNEMSFQGVNKNDDDIETEVSKSKCRADFSTFQEPNSTEESNTNRGFDVEKPSKQDKSPRSKMSWLENKESNESKTKSSFDGTLSGGLEWKNGKRTNTILDDELWNDLIETFDGSDGSGNSFSFQKNKFPGFPQKNAEESRDTNCLPSTRRNYTQIFISEEEEEDDDDDDNNNEEEEEEVEKDSLTLSRNINENKNKPKSSKKREDESSSIREVHHGRESVIENLGKQTSKRSNPSFQQYPKKMFYLDVDVTDNLRIGEFGDVTCCNVGEFKIMQGDKPNNLGDGDQKQISAWDKFPLITEGNRKDKESKIQRQLWTEVRSGNRKNINIMKSESLIQEGEGNMNLKKYIMSHDVNKMQNQNSTCATGQDEPVIIKKSNSANDNKDLESTSNFGANNNQTIILKSASRNLICKSSSLESLKSSSTDTEISLKKCKTVENFRNSFRSTNSLPEQNDIEGVELSETSHFLTDENFEKKNIKEVKESSNLNIFLTKKTKDTIEVKPNSWLIVKNSREKGGKSFKRRSKQKTNVKKQSKHLFCTAERRLLSNRTNTSITLLKLRNTNCFQNFYKRLISIFCATSISTVATSK